MRALPVAALSVVLLNLALAGARDGSNTDERVDRREIDRDALLPMRIGLRSNAEAAAKAEEWLMVSAKESTPIAF